MKRIGFWRIVRVLALAAAVALAVLVLQSHFSELSGATSKLSHLRWTWVLIGVSAEVCSFLAYAIVQKRLLQAGELDLPITKLAALTLASQSIANSLPAGPAVAAVFTFRVYRRNGADEVLAGWALAALLVTISVSLAMVAALGVAIAGGESSNNDLVIVTIGALAIAIVTAVLFVQQRMLLWVLRPILHWVSPLVRRWTGEVDLAEATMRGLTHVTMRSHQVFAALGWGLVNWFLDCGCLLASLFAVGAPIPWKGLLLAYGAGQLAANLPITPGGLGVVEGSITVALVAFGGGRFASDSLVAAVLLYRILSFWVALPIGWGFWVFLAREGRRNDVLQATPTPTTADVGAQSESETTTIEANARGGDTEWSGQ